jgi:hypothetical protein
MYRTFQFYIMYYQSIHLAYIYLIIFNIKNTIYGLMTYFKFLSKIEIIIWLIKRTTLINYTTELLPLPFPLELSKNDSSFTWGEMA